MSSLGVETQGEREPSNDRLSPPLSDSKEEARGRQLGLCLEQNTNGEETYDIDLEPGLLANLTSVDVNTSRSFPAATSNATSKSGDDHGLKTIATPTHPNRVIPKFIFKMSEDVATPNHIQHTAKDADEGSSQCRDTCSVAKSDRSDVFGDALNLNRDVSMGCSSSKMQIQDSQATEGVQRGTSKKDLDSFTTTTAKQVGESCGNVCSSPASMASSAGVSGELPQGSCRKENPQTLPGALAHQRKVHQRYCLPPNAARIKEKYLLAKKYSHLCPKLSKVPKVHLRRLVFVKSTVKPTGSGVKKDRTTESESGMVNCGAVRTAGTKNHIPVETAVKTVTVTGGTTKFNAVNTAAISGGMRKVSAVKTAGGVKFSAVRTATGKHGVPVVNALCVKPSPHNFFTPAKKVIPAAGNKISKGVGANTMQSLQVVVVHPKTHKLQTSSRSETQDKYIELRNQLREAVPEFETAQTENRLLHPGEPGMPLKSHCTCGMAGSDYATKYHFSPEDRRGLEINNVTRVVINGFAFLAFYREEKLFLSYAELVESQVLDSRVVSFTDLLREYPPTVEKKKCVDVMTNQEFAYVKFRNGTPSSLGLITLGVFRRLVVQGRIKWKVFENPKFAGLPLGHLCPKTARDLFFYPHSIFDMDKISQSPANCQKDFSMHVGQICFVKNPIWVFECSKIVFINLKQFFLENELGTSMLETAYSLLQRHGVVLADAPEAVCNTILPMDFDPRKPLSLCSPWVRLLSLVEVLQDLGQHPSIVADPAQQTQVHNMAWLVKELRPQDILWRTDVSFSY